MKCACCETWQKLSYILIIIGALNWGLVGTFNIDLVALIFGVMTPIARTVYILVGVSAIANMICVMRMPKNG